MVMIKSVDYDMEKMVDSAIKELTHMVSSVSSHISEYGRAKPISLDEIASEEILESLTTALTALTSVRRTIEHLQTYPQSLDRVIKLDIRRSTI